MGGGKNLKLILGSLAAVLVIAIAGYGLWGEKQADGVGAGEPEAKLVEIITVQAGKEARYSELSAVLQAGEEALVSFEVGGRIVQLLPAEGDYVRAGQVLARAEATEHDLQISQLQAGLEKARVNYQQALDNHNRLEQLHSAGAVSEKDFEDAGVFLAVAGADYNQAQQALSLLQDKAQLRSPVSGAVIARLASAGQLIGPGTPVYRIGQLDPLKVILPAPDRDIATWQVGEEVELLLYGQTRSGKVVRIHPAASQGTGTIGVELRVANPDRDWFPGQVVNAVRTAEVREGVFVPVGAVINRGEEMPFVFVDVNGKAAKRQVATGDLFGNKLEILEGLEIGDRLVVKGADQLFTGDSIQQPGGSAR
ncbi:MAG: efflux RND transporter periplasmic adaptor subunit [Bacillota bacterium]|jgi:RND family efflux transporter MFP subunit